MNKSLLLLRTLLLSTSQLNIVRHSTDKKVKSRFVLVVIGMFFLYAMLMGYSIAICVGYGVYGIIDAAPVMCALVISILSFAFTMFKTNGYLFNFREYDMLMSLPFEVRTVAACKFMYMYIKSLPWYLSISVSMMIGYAFFAHPSVAVYPIWLILSLILPIIPMLIAAFIGFLIARVSSGFRKNNLVQTILTFIFVIFCFSLRYIIEYVVKDDRLGSTLEQTQKMTENASRYYLPATWFSEAINDLRISSILLIIGVSLLLFSAVFHIVGKSYRNINSAMKNHAAAKRYKMSSAKKRNIVSAIAYKEMKRMLGSTVYMVNAGIGVVLVSMVAIITLIIGFDRLIMIVTQNAPVDPAILRPAIPFIIYFFVGMMATTACSPSLEGKNFWILQSLPIEMKKVYQGKMLFNMWMTVPVSIFATLCMCVSAKVSVLDTVLYLVLGVSLCAFSTAWGCVCGIKHMRLDWENEVEVIKQGAAVTIYLLPNMFVVMGLTVGVVFLGLIMDHALIALVMTGIALLLAALSYLRVMALSKR